MDTKGQGAKLWGGNGEKDKKRKEEGTGQPWQKIKCLLLTSITRGAGKKASPRMLIKTASRQCKCSAVQMHSCMQ